MSYVDIYQRLYNQMFNDYQTMVGQIGTRNEEITNKIQDIINGHQDGNLDKDLQEALENVKKEMNSGLEKVTNVLNTTVKSNTQRIVDEISKQVMEKLEIELKKREKDG